MGQTSAPRVQTEHRLSEAEACDVDLVLADALPHGWVLGAGGTSGTDHASEDDLGALPAGERHAAVRLAARAATGLERPWTLLLRDPEHTPVALLEVTAPPRAVPGVDDVVVHGRLTGLRRRESGAFPDVRLDLSDARAQGRALLVLCRPPTEQDEAVLSAWAGGAGPRPLVVVPEGGERAQHPPAAVLWSLATGLASRLALVEPEVRTVPLRLQDPGRDLARVDGLVGRLAPRRVLRLTASQPVEGAAAWAAAAAELVRGRSTDALPGVAPAVEEALRRWRPRTRERGLVVLLTGLSGSGKSTLARDLDTYLNLRTPRRATLLDGDVVRRLLSSGLGFDREARELNVRRIGWVAARVAEHGGTAICSPIAPFARTRQEVREMVTTVGDLVLVHVSTPLQECERRDLKGLYAAARRGEVPEFTGISSPYEVPEDADVTVDTSHLTRTQALDRLLDHLRAGGWIPKEHP